MKNSWWAISIAVWHFLASCNNAQQFSLRFSCFVTKLCVRTHAVSPNFVSVPMQCHQIVCPYPCSVTKLCVHTHAVSPNCEPYPCSVTKLCAVPMQSKSSCGHSALSQKHCLPYYSRYGQTWSLLARWSSSNCCIYNLQSITCLCLLQSAC